MRLESVYALIAEHEASFREVDALEAGELRARVFGDDIAPLSETGEAVRRYLDLRGALPQPRIALGVGRATPEAALGAHADDYVLAVRAERGASLGALGPLAATTPGEVDVRFVNVLPRLTPAYLQGKRRPLEPGVSIGRTAESSGGTLGAFVGDARHAYILSNSHVLAAAGRGLPGDGVCQPARIDMPASPATMVGLLDRFVPFSPNLPNLVDCALARITAGSYVPGFNAAIPGPIRGVRRLTPEDVGRSVRKIGRTTGIRQGRVTAVGLNGLPVNMGGGFVPRFNEQNEFEGIGMPFSAPGDSGSLIVDADGYAVGLLFAGGEDSTGRDLTFANDLENVFEALGVVLLED